MPFPLLAALIISAAAGAGSSAANSMSQRRNAREQREQDTRERAADRVFDESQLNPYREQLSQAGSLGRLGLMKGASYTPYSMGRGGAYTDALSPSGGFSFESDPRTGAAASALYDSVLRGEMPARDWQDATPPTPGVGRLRNRGTNLLPLVSNLYRAA